jgi:hypothetical protein
MPAPLSAIFWQIRSQDQANNVRQAFPFMPFELYFDILLRLLQVLILVLAFVACERLAAGVVSLQTLSKSGTVHTHPMSAK